MLGQVHCKLSSITLSCWPSCLSIAPQWNKELCWLGSKAETIGSNLIQSSSHLSVLKGIQSIKWITKIIQAQSPKDTVQISWSPGADQAPPCFAPSPLLCWSIVSQGPFVASLKLTRLWSIHDREVILVSSIVMNRTGKYFKIIGTSITFLGTYMSRQLGFSSRSHKNQSWLH